MIHMPRNLSYHRPRQSSKAGAIRALGALFAALLLAPVVRADPHQSAATAADHVKFNRDVRPILSNKCFACHGFDPKHRKAGLRLDTAEGAAAERDGVRAVVPKDLAKSELWARVTSADPELVMPPPDSHKTLTPAERETLRKWIEQGAAYERHWSFEAIRKPAVPASPAAGQGRHPIDAFLSARLGQEKPKVSAEADRPTLARRVAFSSHGDLPPTPGETEAFVADAPRSLRADGRPLPSRRRYGEEMAALARRRPLRRHPRHAPTTSGRRGRS